MYRRCLSYLSESWPAQKSCPAAQVCPQESPILQIKILLQCMHADARDGLRTRGEGRQKVGALPYWPALWSNSTFALPIHLRFSIFTFKYFLLLEVIFLPGQILRLFPVFQRTCTLLSRRTLQQDTGNSNCWAYFVLPISQTFVSGFYLYLSS